MAVEPFERLTSPENLYWAWGKVRRYYETTDAWFNEAEVAAFEVNLEAELGKIRGQFQSKHYRTAPLLPLPQPKSPDKEGRPRVRQAFWVSVADQVAWIALVNVIGPQLEAHMPVWSYGNRLFRPAWFEDAAPHPTLKIGPFRHSAGLLYRKFQHTWPLYRRHIYLTLRQMSQRKLRREMPLAQSEEMTLQVEERLEQTNRLPYLRPDFWRSTVRTPYWASFDLEKFYPRVSLECIKRNARAFCADAPDVVGTLLDDLMHFRLDLKGWSSAELGRIDLDPSTFEFEHIPTGLMAAGFLANVALLAVDHAVAEKVQDSQIAHFRYVDDHVVLAQDFESLDAWIRQYEVLLAEHGVGTTFNAEKFEPEEFGKYYRANSSNDAQSSMLELKKEAKRRCALDAKFPAPLMTKTLGKISEVGRTDFNLLDDREQEAALSDLEHLLVTEFPETELPAPTRVTFAATKITILAAGRQQPIARLADVERETFHLKRRLEEVRRRLANCAQRSQLAEKLRAERNEIGGRLRALSTEVRRLRTDLTKATQRERARVFAMLVKAVREYPEKLRLWERVLEYCRVTGQSQLRPLMDELYRQFKASPLASRLLRAHILHLLAGHLVRCARVITSDDHPPYQQTVAGEFLVSALDWARRLLPHRDPKYYEAHSAQLCQIAAGCAIELLADAGDSGRLHKKLLRDVTRRARALGAVNWQDRPQAWIKRSPYSLVTWLWWVESATQSALATSPGPIWRAVAGCLDPRDSGAWSLWSRYPEALPAKARKRILRTSSVPPFRDAGWLIELASVLDERELPRARDPKFLALRPQSVEGYLNLREWSAKTREMYAHNPFDPRVGEWTALRIVQQILEAAVQRQDTVPLHWSTVLVPEKWAQHDGRRLRWDVWHNAINGSRAILRSPESEAQIEALFRASRDSGTDPEFGRVQEAGLILLGLVRRGFNWPAAWRSPGLLAEAGWVTRTLIQEAQVSSWTTGILESCLLPRQRENVLLRLLFFGPAWWDDDTTNDPPPIFTLKRLARYVDKALNVLEQGQITVRDHLPRQLVPLRVEQVARAEWGLDNEAELQPEDDDQ